MLKDKVEYRDPGEDYYYEKFKVRLIRTLKDKASFSRIAAYSLRLLNEFLGRRAMIYFRTRQ